MITDACTGKRKTDNQQTKQTKQTKPTMNTPTPTKNKTKTLYTLALIAGACTLAVIVLADGLSREGANTIMTGLNQYAHLPMGWPAANGSGSLTNDGLGHLGWNAGAGAGAGGFDAWGTNAASGGMTNKSSPVTIDGGTWPTSNGSGSLTNDGAGNLGWGTPAAPTASGPSVYRALLAQTGTAAPVATVLENSLGHDVSWSRAGSGLYFGTVGGGFFQASKTFGLRGPGGFAVASGDGGGVFFGRDNDDRVVVQTSDGTLQGMPIEILVYQ